MKRKTVCVDPEDAPLRSQSREYTRKFGRLAVAKPSRRWPDLRKRASKAACRKRFFAE